MQLRLFLLLVVLLTLSILPVTACTNTTCNNSEWQDILWKLKSYGPANNLQPVQGNVDITLKFYNSEREISGSGGCNHYFGSYAVNSDCDLQISALGATEMACADSALMQQEQKYFHLLQNADKIEVRDGELRITSDNEIMVYVR